MAWMTTAEGWIALLTLTVLEIVLGIDNIVFIAILTARLPADRQANARRTGLILALGLRIGLLFAIAWIMSLTRPLFSLLGHAFSGRDLILLGGGLFLIAKATWEIYDKLEVEHHEAQAKGGRASMTSVIVQILLLDIVFSLDSVITAIGMANSLAVMIAAVVIALLVMLRYAGAVSDFVHQHPTLKMLALSFLLLIGVTLVAEGTHQHVNKGYIYFAMAFSFGVELLNLKLSKKSAPVQLHEPQP